MDETREKESPHPLTPLLTRTVQPQPRVFSVSPLSSVEEAVGDVTKQLELLESPSRKKGTSTDPPTPRPTSKSTSRPGIAEARAWRSSDKPDFIPYHETAGNAEARQGQSTKIVSKKKNLIKGKPSRKSKDEIQQLLTTIKKACDYDGSKLPSKSKQIPQQTIRKREEKSDVQFAAFTKSEPLPTIQDSSQEKYSDGHLFKTPVSPDKYNSKGGRLESETKIQMPSKRNVSQAKGQDEPNFKRPRKMLTDLELSPSPSCSNSSNKTLVGDKLTRINEKLDNIEKTLTTILEKKDSQKERDLASRRNNIRLPVQSLDELYELEDLIRTDPLSYAYVVDTLAKAGGCRDVRH